MKLTMHPQGRIYLVIAKSLILCLLPLMLLWSVHLNLESGALKESVTHQSQPNKLDYPDLFFLPGQADLVIFYESTCKQCVEAKPFIVDILKSYTKLKPVWINLIDNPQYSYVELKHFLVAYKVSDQKAGGLPLVFIGDRFLSGLEEIRDHLKKDVSLYASGRLKPVSYTYRLKPSEALTSNKPIEAFLKSISIPEYWLIFLPLLILSLFFRKNSIQLLLLGWLFFTTDLFIYLLISSGHLSFLFTQNSLSLFPTAIYFYVFSLSIAIFCWTALLRSRIGLSRSAFFQTLVKTNRLDVIGIILFLATGLSSLLSYPFFSSLYIPYLYYKYNFSGVKIESSFYIASYYVLLRGPIILIFLGSVALDLYLRKLKMTHFIVVSSSFIRKIITCV